MLRRWRSAVYAAIDIAYAPPATLIAGQAAGRQFEKNESGYVAPVYFLQFLSGTDGIATLIFLFCVAAIWRGPMRSIAFAGLAVLGVHPQPASALRQAGFYGSLHDLPNESAFWIPDAGANKDNQVRSESEEYLNANKVPVTSAR